MITYTKKVHLKNAMEYWKYIYDNNQPYNCRKIIYIR